MLPWKFQKTPTKMLAKEKRLKLSRARIKVRIRRKILLIPQRKASDAGQTADPGVPKTKA